MIADLLQAAAAGIAGGLTVRGLAAFARTRRPSTPSLVEVEPGTVIEEANGRRWTVEQRTIDLASGGPARLSVELIERAAP